MSARADADAPKAPSAVVLARSPYTCMMTAAFSPDAALAEPFSDADSAAATSGSEGGGGSWLAVRRAEGAFGGVRGRSSSLRSDDAGAAGRWWDPRRGWASVAEWHERWLAAAAADDAPAGFIKRVALTPTPSTSPTLLSTSASGSSLSSFCASPAPTRAALEAHSMALLPPFMLALPPPAAERPLPHARKRGSAIEGRAPWRAGGAERGRAAAAADGGAPRRCRALSCPPVPSPRAAGRGERPLFPLTEAAGPAAVLCDN